MLYCAVLLPELMKSAMCSISRVESCAERDRELFSVLSFPAGQGSWEVCQGPGAPRGHCWGECRIHGPGWGLCARSEGSPNRGACCLPPSSGAVCGWDVASPCHSSRLLQTPLDSSRLLFLPKRLHPRMSACAHCFCSLLHSLRWSWGWEWGFRQPFGWGMSRSTLRLLRCCLAH